MHGAAMVVLQFAPLTMIWVVQQASCGPRKGTRNDFVRKAEIKGCCYAGAIPPCPKP